MAPTSPAEYLSQCLPTYNDPQADDDGPGEVPSRSVEGRSKAAVFEDAPMSVGEFERGWTEMCAFELERLAWKPALVTLRGVWTSFLSAVHMKGLKVNEPIRINQLSAMVQEDGYPEPLLLAMVRRLSAVEQGAYEEGRLFDIHISNADS